MGIDTIIDQPISATSDDVVCWAQANAERQKRKKRRPSGFQGIPSGGVEVVITGRLKRQKNPDAGNERPDLPPVKLNAPPLKTPEQAVE